MQTRTDPVVFHISHHRTGASSSLPSDPSQTPLDAERTWFVSMVSALLVVQLCASIALVISVTVMVNDDGRGFPACGVDCRLWCAADCRLVDGGREGGLGLKTVEARYSAEAGSDRTLCCVGTRDLLSTIYETSVQQKFVTRDINDKLFDGIRVTERWIEDSLNNWPKNNQPSVVYYKKIRTFRILSSGTYFVHSRIDFNCSTASDLYKQKILVHNDSHPNSFEDIRIHLRKNESTVYTSSIDVMVELTREEQLEMVTEPKNCTSPRSIVVYRLQDL